MNNRAEICYWNDFLASFGNVGASAGIGTTISKHEKNVQMINQAFE